jgi:murein L,D-transpeptidase YcbB/YkuD
MPIRRLLAAIVASLVLGVSPVAQADDQVAAAIRSVVETGLHPWLHHRELGDEYQAAARAVYEGDSWEAIWLDDEEPSDEAKEVITHLAAAAVWGLEPNDYDADRLAWEAERLQTKPRPPDADVGYFDVGLTVAVMRYATESYLGRVDPRRLGFRLGVAPKPLDLPRVVHDLASDSPEKRLGTLDPPFPLFGRLVVALARMRAVAERTDLPVIPEDLPKLRQGDRSPAVPGIRRLLTILGDLPETAAHPASPTRYDAALAAAVRRFQERHGRADDAVIGKATLQDLRVPPQQRVQQIELAMERLRWLPAEVADRFIVVNVPEFRLRAFETGSEIPRLTMGVVVGSAAHGTETPVLLADMRYVIFQPIWTVPDEIAREEILPKAAKNPAYLESQNMEYDQAGRLRQRPGPNNSLGLGEVHPPEPVPGVPARHPGEGALPALAARLQPRLHQGCRPCGARGVRPRRRLGPRAHHRGHETGPGPQSGGPGSADSGVSALCDRGRGPRRPHPLLRRHLRPRRPTGAGACKPLPRHGFMIRMIGDPAR